MFWCRFHCFIAVVFAFGRLQADSEMTVMLALGISPLRLLRPVLALALALGLGVAFMSLIIRPIALCANPCHLSARLCHVERECHAAGYVLCQQ